MSSSFRYPEYFKAPIAVQWELTRHCNLNCIHCYYDPRPRGNELSLEECLKIVDEMARLRFEVILTGGELLLKQDWEKIAEALYENRIHVALVTNGMLVTRDVARFLSEIRVKMAQVSIDGATDVTHDTIRGVKGLFERAVKAVEYLVEYDVPVRLAMVLTKLNWHEVEAYIDLAVKLGVRDIVLGTVIPYGRAALNIDLLKLEPHQYNEVVRIVRRKERTWTEGENTNTAVRKPTQVLRRTSKVCT